MKTGLVLEGGAMRGLFTAGVIDVMMENGIEFDGAVGVSAGAAFGCNYKTKQIWGVQFVTISASQKTDGMPLGGRSSPQATTLTLNLPTIRCPTNWILPTSKPSVIIQWSSGQWLPMWGRVRQCTEI